MTEVPARPDFVTVGKITGTWGVRGWLKLYSYTEKREDILDYKPWRLCRAAKETEVTVLEGRRQGNGMVARLQGVETREQAEQWTGYSILVRRDALPSLPEGEYYWRDLIGLQAVTRQGIALGEVTGLLETGANDVLVIQGDRQRLVPFTHQVVWTVDLDKGWIQLDWDPEYE